MACATEDVALEAGGEVAGTAAETVAIVTPAEAQYWTPNAAAA